MITPFETEEFLSWKDKLPNHKVDMGNVVAVLQHAEGRDLVETFIYGNNVITNEGISFYAKQSAPTLDLGTTTDFYNGTRMELQNPSSSDTTSTDDTYSDVSNPITDSRISINVEINNTDNLNTSITADERATTITYKAEYSPTSFNTDGVNNITGGCIHSSATPTANTVLLSHWNFDTSFPKSVTDSVTIWLNHRIGRA